MRRALGDLVRAICFGLIHFNESARRGSKQLEEEQTDTRDNAPRMSVDLSKLRLVGGDWQTGTVKDNESGTRGALVNSTNELVFQIIGARALILDD